MFVINNFRRLVSPNFTSVKRYLGRLEKHKVVPDAIDEVPKEKLKVKYKKLEADFGNILTPTQVNDPPTVTWDCKTGVYYTLCMIDLDAPSRKDPKWREWQHWLVVNIGKTKVAFGNVLSQYIPSAPPKGTGLHRYVFIVYEQPKKMEFHEKKFDNNTAQGRENFSIRKFAKRYKLGNPIAANFFQAEWDTNVVKVNRRLEQNK